VCDLKSVLISSPTMDLSGKNYVFYVLASTIG
jgi:hypothetical protein